MQKLSIIQKILLGIAILIFLTINIASLIIIINSKLSASTPQSPTNNSITDIKTTSYDENGNTIEEKGYFLAEDISIDEGYFKAEYPNKVTIFSSSPAQFSLENKGFPSVLNLTVTKGILFVDTKVSISLELSKKNITIPANVNIIYDAEDSSIILVSGEIQLERNKKVTSNNQIIYDIDHFQTYKFDRSEYQTGDYANLVEFLTIQNSLPDNLNDFEAPSFTSIAPKDGFSTKESVIRFFGFTEEGAVAYINDKEIQVDEEGEFSTQIELKTGRNIVKLILEDKYGNQQLFTFTYTKLQPVSGVISYPVSFPTSYTQ